MNHTITTEQLEALESEYMTRDSISIIVNEVRTKEAAPTTKENKDLKTAVRMLRKLFDNNCVLYDLADTRGYCSTSCPLHSGAAGTASCTPRAFLHKFGHGWEDTP
jgi:hypothetical protein